jgi:hypothetical protein
LSPEKAVKNLKLSIIFVFDQALTSIKPNIKVELNPTTVNERKSLKEARGGCKKWTLGHLPDNRGPEFTDLVAPLIRKKVGASISPWDNLKVKEIQEIVDGVFGNGKYKVVEDGPWYGLVRQ